MIILDIDKDFFYSPIHSGTVIDGYPENEAPHQEQATGVGSVIYKFSKFIGPNTRMNRFTHHDQVGDFIERNDFKDITLYHLDAHSDIDSTWKEGDPMGIWNWISCTKDRYDQVYWVLGESDIKSTVPENLLDPKTDTYSLKNVPDPISMIDFIVWTDSPGWCPQDSELFEVLKGLL